MSAFAYLNSFDGHTLTHRLHVFGSVPSMGMEAYQPLGTIDHDIALVDVELRVVPGYRVHCFASGWLGFAHGTMAPEGEGLIGRKAGLFCPVRFDGERFVMAPGNRPLVRCRRLILTPDGRGVAALLHDDDAACLVDGLYARKAVDSNAIDDRHAELARAAMPSEDVISGRTREDDAGDLHAFEHAPDPFEMV